MVAVHPSVELGSSLAAICGEERFDDLVDQVFGIVHRWNATLPEQLASWRADVSVRKR